MGLRQNESREVGGQQEAGVAGLSPEQLAQAIKEEADRLGFELVGISPVSDPPHE